MATTTWKQEESRIVLHIISKKPKDFPKEINAFRDFDNHPYIALDVKDGSLKILDPPTPSHDEAISETTGSKARVYEFHATIKMHPSLPDDEIKRCIHLRNSGPIRDFQYREDVQMNIQPLDVFHAHRTPGLAIFDMDSTLIQQEVIDELARKTGKGDECAAITERAMRGELDFEESLRERVAFIAGTPKTIWQTLINEVITITPGARDLISALRGLGWKTAVASGGFMPLATWLKGELGMDYALANQLEMDEEGENVTGKILPGSQIVHGLAKRGFLLDLAKQNGIAMHNTIAVGDGSNDLPMMEAAGWGVAFNAKPKVQKEAPGKLNSDSLLDVMYLLGFNKTEIEEAVEKGKRIAK